MVSGGLPARKIAIIERWVGAESLEHVVDGDVFLCDVGI